MKKTLLHIVLFLFVGITAHAQAPGILNYQGVARNISGAPLVSTAIGLRLTIHDGSPGGTTVYQETHAPTTNTFGLYNVGVGSGTVVSGSFGAINWGSGGKYLEVEIDPAGGTAYTSAGTNQLLSVPYAIYANSAGGGITSTGTANYVSKFSSPTALANSMLFDNGTTVGVNTITPSSMAKLHVSGVGTYGALPYYQAGIVADGGATAGSASGIYSEGGWRGVYGRNPGSATGVEAIGVLGRCEGSTYTGTGYGVKGENTGSGGSANHGVYGTSTGGGAKNYGVYGTATGATTNNYGVYGAATGTGPFAGYFSGNVTVTGTLAKGGGTFKIDHPLDPENKYLYHSFVESPDMMNIYNGNVVTDASGNATVTLPAYFEALNKDFRYQLTVIGTFAQAIVSEEMNNNHFTIKTDKPNVKVSWLVTGIRHDKFAEAHPVVPEVNKEKEYQGRYLHAAEWGMPDSRSIDILNRPVEATETNTKK